MYFCKWPKILFKKVHFQRPKKKWHKEWYLCKSLHILCRISLYHPDKHQNVFLRSVESSESSTMWKLAMGETLRSSSLRTKQVCSEVISFLKDSQYKKWEEEDMASWERGMLSLCQNWQINLWPFKWQAAERIPQELRLPRADPKKVGYWLISSSFLESLFEAIDGGSSARLSFEQELNLNWSDIKIQEPALTIVCVQCMYICTGQGSSAENLMVTCTNKLLCLHVFVFYISLIKHMSVCLFIFLSVNTILATHSPN